MTDIDSTRRGDLTGTAAALAHTLDDWLFTQHGVTSGSHNAGAFLELAAGYGLQVVPARPALSANAHRELAALAQVEGPMRPEAILTAHSRMEEGGCLCGWNMLGRTHAGHQVDELRAAGVLP